jgi:archaellum component FlaG (FlaF/FlaG flagellin family)
MNTPLAVFIVIVLVVGSTLTLMNKACKSLVLSFNERTPATRKKKATEVGWP